MYLILDHKEAELRNCYEALKRGWNMYRTKKWWQEIVSESQTALVVGDMDGLTEDEIGQCVAKLPKGFEPKLDADD